MTIFFFFLVSEKYSNYLTVLFYSSNYIQLFQLFFSFWSPNYYGSHGQDHHIMFAVIHYQVNILNSKKIWSSILLLLPTLHVLRSAFSVNNVDCSTAMKDISTPALMSHFKRLAYTVVSPDTILSNKVCCQIIRLAARSS